MDENRQMNQRVLGMSAAAMLIGSVLGLSRASAGPIVFQDTFSNGNVAQNESGENYWYSAPNSPGVNGVVTEASGAVNLIAGGAGSDGNTKFTSLFSNNRTTASTFNFFQQALTFDVKFSYSGDTPLAAQNFIFGLASENSKDSYGANDAVQIRLQPNSTKFFGAGSKENSSSLTVPRNWLSDALLGVSSAVTINEVKMTLDATSYEITAFWSGGSKTFSGLHGLTQANWGDGTGNSVLFFQALRGTNAATQMTVSIDEVTVSLVPEPASLSLLALGGFALIKRHR